MPKCLGITIRNVATGLLAVTLLTISTLSPVAADSTGIVPKDGFVPDAQTATQIAEAILVPIYGKTVIEGERPFRAPCSED